jgi:hypothetical protein
MKKSCSLDDTKAEDARLSELKLHQYYLYQIRRLYFKEKTELKGLFILLFPFNIFHRSFSSL